MENQGWQFGAADGSARAGGGPGGVVRSRREKVEAGRDREMLEWIGRFRFVSREALAQRFGVSKQAVGTRVRRLEAAGLVACEGRRLLGQTGVLWLTTAGLRAIGLRPRRAPRIDLQRAHELAIAGAVARLESGRHAPNVEVLTERDCRGREADGRGTYHVDLRDGVREAVSRWPDVVLRTSTGTRVIEFEFAAKTTERLGKIIAGYVTCAWVDHVRFVVESPALAARLLAIATRETARRQRLDAALARQGRRVSFSVRAATTASDAARDRIDALVASHAAGRLAA